MESAERIKLFLTKEFQGYGRRDLPIQEAKKKNDNIDFASLHLPETVSDITPKLLLDSIIGARIEEIYKLIAEEIEKSGFSSNVPSGLVITGGGAHTIGMVEMGRKVVGLPIRIGFPTGVSGLGDEVLDPQYATNVGLILSGGKNIIDHESSMKKFNQIFKDISIGGSVSKIKDLLKQFIP